MDVRRSVEDPRFDADVNILGGFARSYQISPHVEQMAALGISTRDLIDLLEANNLNAGVGRVIQGNDTLITRSEGRLKTLEDIASLVIARNGINYRLGDVADVAYGHLTRYGSVTRDGEETTEALVIALKDSNTAEVAFSISKEYQGKGLGKLFIRKLARAARDNGISGLTRQRGGGSACHPTAVSCAFRNLPRTSNPCQTATPSAH